MPLRAPQLSGHSDTLSTARTTPCLILRRPATLQLETKGPFRKARNQIIVNLLQILLCQGAGVACPGLYPLVLPKHGYRGQLAWMESVAVIGTAAFKILNSAAKEGELCFPRFIRINLLCGKTFSLDRIS